MKQLYRHLGALGLVALTLALVGAGCGGGDDDDVGPDGDGDIDVDSDVDSDGDSDGDADNDPPDDGPDHDYVSDTLVIGEITEGFNLDNHVTIERDDPEGCGKEDGPNGIDNQLGPLIDGIVQGAGLDFNPDELLAQNIQEGSLLLLLRLLDVDNDTRDPHVPLYFFLGDDADEELSNNLGGSGHFTVNPVSLEVDTDIDSGLIHFEHGEISGGGYSTPPDLFQLTVPLSNDLVLDLAIEQAQIEFRYAESGLTEGVVGGFVRTETILRAIQNLDIQDVDVPESLVRSVLGAQADIDAVEPGPVSGTACTQETIAQDCQPGQSCENGVCVEPVGRCDALSLGLTFSAVPATIDGISPPPDDPPAQ